MGVRFDLRCLSMLEQLLEEALTCFLVWLIMEEMICGSDLELRLGNEVSVDTQSSG